MKPNYTPEEITTLGANDIFCFGSNMNGRHAGGAAAIAVEKFGAIEGQAEGLQGQSYAIPTLSKKMQKLALGTISKSIQRLMSVAESMPDKTFYITKIGCGIAGFEVTEIAGLFQGITLPDNVIIPKEFTRKVVIGFKGFNKDFQCTPNGKSFQYEAGKSYEEPSADLCSRGFHFCENPLSVLNYYPLKDGNRYAKVEGEYVSDKTEGDTKRVSKKITIKAEIGIGDLIRSSVEWIMSRAKTKSGNCAHSATSGKYANSATSGNCAHSATKDTAVAAAIGINGKAKGEIGCWIVVAEWVSKGNEWEIRGVKSAKVDGKKIKADTYYSLVDGKFKEA